MPADQKKTNEIIKLLIKAYNGEIETVMNYLAHSVNLDGVRANHIKDSLSEDVTEELGHAQRLAARIKTLGGITPGSQKLKWDQSYLQPSDDTTTMVPVIRGVIEAEDQAIALYEKIIEVCDGVDYVTQDLAIEILGDEQQHRREFIGFLTEYEKSGQA